MFTISISTGFLVYLTVMFAGLGAAIIYETWRSGNQAWRLSEEQLCRCPNCSLTFIVPRKESTAHCPRCNRRCTVRQK